MFIALALLPIHFTHGLAEESRLHAVGELREREKNEREGIFNRQSSFETHESSVVIASSSRRHRVVIASPPIMSHDHDS